MVERVLRIDNKYYSSKQTATCFFSVIGSSAPYLIMLFCKAVLQLFLYLCHLPQSYFFANKYLSRTTMVIAYDDFPTVSIWFFLKFIPGSCLISFTVLLINSPINFQSYITT